MAFVIYFVILGFLYLLWKYYLHLMAVNRHVEIPGLIFPTYWNFLFDMQYSFLLNPTTIHQYFAEFGPVFKVIAGDWTYLFVNDPELIRNILVRDVTKFGKAKIFKSEVFRGRKLQNMAEMDTTPEWKRLRTIAAKAFTDVTLLESFEASFDRITDELIKRISANAPGVVNVSKYVNMMGMDIIGAAGFGYEFNSLKNDDSKYSEMGKSFFSAAKVRALAPSWTINLPIPPFSQISAGVNEYRTMMLNIIASRREDLEREKKVSGTDLLSIMMSSSDVDGSSMSDDELLTATEMFIAAGFETTSTTIMWALYYMALNPSVQETARQEVKEYFVHHERLTYKEISESFPFLKCVIKETLRILPPVSSLPRTTIEQSKIGEFEIDADTEVILSVEGLHSSPTIWGLDANQFRPSRFLDLKNEKSIFIPFGLGQRNCVGNRFAELEASLTIAKILNRFEIIAKEEHKGIGRLVEITQKPDRDIKLIFNPITRY